MVDERVSWIEGYGIPLHCWNYTSFKRIVGVWGELISLGENSTLVKSYDKMSMSVSINQSERIDELINLEVGNIKFPIRVVEMGLWESLGDNSRDHGVKGREGGESVQDKEDTFTLESESAMRPGSKKVPEERQGWEDEAINTLILEKSNNNKRCQNTLQNMLRLEEEQLSGKRAEPRLGEKDKSGYNNWAMEDVSNMNFSVAELGLENMEGAQDEQREMKECVGLVVDLGLRMDNSKE